MSRVSCYPSDLTDAEWALVEPLLPPPGEGGRPEKHPRREVVDAILYVVRTGCAWRQLPADFPPWQTVYWYFARWEEQRVTLRMLDALRWQLRLADGRDGEPSAGIIDSQSADLHHEPWVAPLFDSPSAQRRWRNPRFHRTDRRDRGAPQRLNLQVPSRTLFSSGTGSARSTNG